MPFFSHERRASRGFNSRTGKVYLAPDTRPECDLWPASRHRRNKAHVPGIICFIFLFSAFRVSRGEREPDVASRLKSANFERFTFAPVILLRIAVHRDRSLSTLSIIVTDNVYIIEAREERGRGDDPLILLERICASRRSAPSVWRDVQTAA